MQKEKLIKNQKKNRGKYKTAGAMINGHVISHCKLSRIRMKVANVQPRPVSWTCHQVAPLFVFFFLVEQFTTLSSVSGFCYHFRQTDLVAGCEKCLQTFHCAPSLSLSVSFSPSHSFLILIHAPHLRPHCACMVIRARLFARTSLSTFAPTFLD